jgi:sensor histidine kinase YesM
MTLHDLVFTAKKPEKYFRHIGFWVFQSVFWFFWAGTFFCSLGSQLDWVIKFYGFFVLDISYTYLIAYYFSPKYLERKRASKFCISVLLLTILCYVLYVPYHLWVFGYFKQTLDEQLLMTWYFSINFFITGPPVMCAMFLTLKMLKNYYIKMEEKQILTRENANAELQLLKAQVHPHFLFNTLNNIYSFSLDQSPRACDLVLKLTDTLRYMIYGCEEPFVPLEKELKLLQDYMGLEKVRYGSRLNMQLKIKGDAQNKFITPLLMISFVENSFKHGTSQMLQHPWIMLQIEIEERLLVFELSNSKPLTSVKKNGKGIGLINVQKRLHLIYPNQHQLHITSTEDSFCVHMQVALRQTAIPSVPEIVECSSSKTYAYA